MKHETSMEKAFELLVSMSCRVRPIANLVGSFQFLFYVLYVDWHEIDSYDFALQLQYRNCNRTENVIELSCMKVF